MRALVLALIAACAEPPTHTLGESAELVARANCSRWIACGTTDEAWRTCVQDLVWDFCQDHVCSDPYPDWEYDDVEACTDWFVTVSCTRYVEACYL